MLNQNRAFWALWVLLCFLVVENAFSNSCVENTVHIQKTARKKGLDPASQREEILNIFSVLLTQRCESLSPEKRDGLNELLDRALDEEDHRTFVEFRKVVIPIGLEGEGSIPENQIPDLIGVYCPKDLQALGCKMLERSKGDWVFEGYGIVWQKIEVSKKSRSKKRWYLSWEDKAFVKSGIGCGIDAGKKLCIKREKVHLKPKKVEVTRKWMSTWTPVTISVPTPSESPEENIAPVIEELADPPTQKDIVFILDVSGSMYSPSESDPMGSIMTETLDRLIQQVEGLSDTSRVNFSFTIDGSRNDQGFSYMMSKHWLTPNELLDKLSVLKKDFSNLLREAKIKYDAELLATKKIKKKYRDQAVSNLPLPGRRVKIYPDRYAEVTFENTSHYAGASGVINYLNSERQSPQEIVFATDGGFEGVSGGGTCFDAYGTKVPCVEYKTLYEVRALKESKARLTLIPVGARPNPVFFGAFPGSVLK